MHRRENVAFQRVNAEKQHERAGRGDPSGRKAREHHDQSADQRADRRNEGEQSGLDAENERALDADDRKPDPGDEEHREHGEDLRDQPALQRLADAVDDHGGAGAMPRRRHEQQPLAIDARLRREGQPEKQHDKEISDRAQGAQQQFEGLADDRAAAGGERAGAGKIMRRAARRRRRCRRSRRRARDCRDRNSWYRCRFAPGRL